MVGRQFIRRLVLRVIGAVAMQPVESEERKLVPTKQAGEAAGSSSTKSDTSRKNRQRMIVETVDKNTNNEVVCSEDFNTRSATAATPNKMTVTSIATRKNKIPSRMADQALLSSSEDANKPLLTKRNWGYNLTRPHQTEIFQNQTKQATKSARQEGWALKANGATKSLPVRTVVIDPRTGGRARLRPPPYQSSIRSSIWMENM